MPGMQGIPGIQAMQGMPMFGGYPGMGGMGLSSGGFQMGPGGMIAVVGNQQGQKK